MAEYIDRMQAMRTIAEGKDDKPYFRTTDDDIDVIYFLKAVPVADVIERAEYDKMMELLIGKNKDLKTMRDNYFKLQREFAELKDNINKAIEAMENEVELWEEPSKYDVKPVVSAQHAKAQSYRHALEIVKSYIGDSK